MEEKLEMLCFSGVWCNPCKMIAPIINQIMEDNKDNEKIIIKKYDVDENKDFALSLNVRSVPTILFIKNGEVLHKINGATSKKVLLEKIEELS